MDDKGIKIICNTLTTIFLSCIGLFSLYIVFHLAHDHIAQGKDGTVLSSAFGALGILLGITVTLIVKKNKKGE